MVEKWGVKIGDPEKEFKLIDKNGDGQLAYYEFCNYAIQKQLDLEDDDDFYDPELEMLK